MIGLIVLEYKVMKLEITRIAFRERGKSYLITRFFLSLGDRKLMVQQDVHI